MLSFTCFTIFIIQKGKQLTLIVYTEHCQLFYQLNFVTEHNIIVYGLIKIKLVLNEKDNL